MPENAACGVRLEALAHAASVHVTEASGRAIGVEELKVLCNEPSLQMLACAEGPSDICGGSYIIG